MNGARRAQEPRRRRRWGERGQGGVEYVALIGVVAAIVAAIVAVAVPADTAVALDDAVCRIVNAADGPEECDSGDGGEDGDGDDGDGEIPDGPPGDPFQPAKCLLSQDQTKTTVVIQIVFIKISGSEQLKVQQWSDGTVTLERVTDSSVGVTASVSAGIPGLKDWGGSASLNGTYSKGKGQGGQWVFASNKSDDPQADLAANLADAEEFAAALKQSDVCDAMIGSPVSPISQVGCKNNAVSQMQAANPERMPDVDITKTTTEASGGLSLGKSFKKGAGGKDANGKSTDLGSVSGDGLTGSMTEDVVVLRTNTGPDAGKITFVYTFTVDGKGGQVAQGKATRMQQVAVTYDAATYDQEERDGREHRPQKMVITTSEENGAGAGVQVGAGANVPGTPVTIDVGGGGGTIQSQIHTESAELVLDNDPDSKLVEDWLRGRGDFPASDALPTPSDAAEVPGPDAGPIERLLHDKGKLSRLDYNANTDWWNASLGIGFGISAGQVTMGFKLFGIDITHEEKEQTITGDPTYATGPKNGGARPWVEWKNCTQTSPIV
ncbi:hypothetical protein OG875_20155 [Streptomyces sp. NBC_01498]|uniref:hypothetical protein n=1 Tax=Streptomyces sp. NBC_01498 TaxID=2975870 RepID=UPI002E7C01E5|nr:hypothetical protein [Streptomyces sp. NBC_01498]WTL26670.1 hypothetical protein OG875_20155 [Streptomyces sp. NBC_01498]